MSEFGVNVDDLLGLSIHSFHKDPAGVDRILARPAPPSIRRADSAREISSAVDEVVHSIGGTASATGAAREAAAALSTKAAELDQLVAGVQA